MVLATDFPKHHTQRYSSNMFEHVHKKHKKLAKKYMVLEVRDELQVCRSDAIDTHSSIVKTAESDKKKVALVIALSLRLSGRLKLIKPYFELGTNVLTDEDDG